MILFLVIGWLVVMLIMVLELLGGFAGFCKLIHHVNQDV
jgi:hypothetical protein